MPTLVVVDIGTYCDTRLMDDAMSRIAIENDLVYVVDIKREIPLGRNGQQPVSYRFKTPSVVSGSSSKPNSNAKVDFPLFDPASNPITWGLTHPNQAMKAFKWVTKLKRLTKRAINENGASGMVMHYAATMLLWKLSPELLKSVPIFVIYHAPGLISQNVPWIFDPILKNPDFHLYESGTKYKKLCLKSWYSYYTKIAVFITVSMKPSQIRSKVAKLHHLQCWDEAATMPLIPGQKNLKIHQIGALYNERYANQEWYGDSKEPAWLAKFLVKPTILVSFGTFASSKELIQILPFILNSLETIGVQVLFHLTTSVINIVETPLRRVLKGWIPYEWAVPKCAAVIFTGSVCLQTVCAYNRVPMIFVPLLAEQFFWARNYEAMTGTPFIDYQSSSNAVSMNTIEAWLTHSGSAKTKAYLKSLSASMKRNDGVKRIAKVVKDVLNGSKE